MISIYRTIHGGPIEVYRHKRTIFINLGRWVVRIGHEIWI